jgi:hypothetical protein
MSFPRSFRFSLAGLAMAASIGALLQSAPDANAQNRREYCEDYAREAVKQAEANERRNCGFEGKRWSDNRAAHFSWCLLFPRQAEKEGEARKEQLDDCRSDRRAERTGKRASCETYASIAVVQAEANKKYDCGYRGGEWIAEERPHMRWCMRSRRDYLLDEIRFRVAELQKCFEKLGDYDDDGNDRGYKRRRF